jgi:hypothetical protein
MVKHHSISRAKKKILEKSICETHQNLLKFEIEKIIDSCKMTAGNSIDQTTNRIANKILKKYNF